MYGFGEGLSTTFRWDSMYKGAGPNKFYILDGAGIYDSGTAINGIYFAMTSGNIAQGNFSIYSIR